jgi:hypothetical protein
MTYFADLSDYTYMNSDYSSRPATKNVGWLGEGNAFEVAEPSEELLDKLWSFCKISVAQTRGIHRCEFCIGKNVHFSERNGDALLLGSSEIRVFGEDKHIYAAPTLIYHYVKVHGYKPPQEFIQAVMRGPAPSEHDYFNRLEELGLEWRKTSVPQPDPIPNFQPNYIPKA